MRNLNLTISPAQLEQRALPPLHLCIGTSRKAKVSVTAKDAGHLRQYHAVGACIDDGPLTVRHSVANLRLLTLTSELADVNTDRVDHTTMLAC